MDTITKRTPYRYCPLLSEENQIRLIRLMPSEDKNATLECQLFNYSLKSRKRTNLYEALSYVWGDPKETATTNIDKCFFNVTKNLHATLLRLRDDRLERILWVDALCINQVDEREKERQIRLKAKIYGHANSVVVWLGESENVHERDSDNALEVIRSIAEIGHAVYSNNQWMGQAIQTLLQRQWFRRIWVLQEIAVARHILVMSGSTAVDGHAFRTGLESLMGLIGRRTDLEGPICSVVSPTKGAIFRSRRAKNVLETSSLNICPLGDLIDMAHTHEASWRHDKVYALPGMASDDFSTADILPDYRLPWEELLGRLVKFLLGAQISIQTWASRETVAIDCKACILGKVTSVGGVQGNKQTVYVIPRAMIGLKIEEAYEARWILSVSAKAVNVGDIICLVKGAPKTTIIRPCKGHFAIIMIATSSVEEPTENRRWESRKLIESATFPPHGLLLVWDWERSAHESLDLREHEIEVGRRNHTPESPMKAKEDLLDKANKIWGIARVLEDMEEYKMAKKLSQEATEIYKEIFGETNSDSCATTEDYQTSLSWAIKTASIAALTQIFIKCGIGYDLKDGSRRTPLFMQYKTETGK